MAHSYAFNDIVSTVSNAFDPKTDPRVSAIVEEYRRSVDDHNKSPTPSLLIKRRQAFAKLQRLHNEVRARIKAEIIEYEDTSLFVDDDIDKQKIYWAVMQSHGELDPVDNSDSKQANFMDLRTIHDTLPPPEVKGKSIPRLWVGTVKDNYRFCNHRGCDWKTELNIWSTNTLRNHIVNDHSKRLFPCRKGCRRVFTKERNRLLHEASKHGNSAAWQTTTSRKGIGSLNSSANSETHTENLPAEDATHSSEEIDLKDPVEESDDHELTTSIGEPSESETNGQAGLDPGEDLTKIGGHNSTDVDMKDIGEAVSNDHDGFNKECYPEINRENALDFGYTPAENLGEDATAVDPIHSTAATTEDAVGKIKAPTTSDGSFHHCTHPGCPWKVRVHQNAGSTIRKHIQIKHRGIRFSCRAPGCDKSYTESCNRRKHELEKHGIVTTKPGTVDYPCPMLGCQLTFISTYHRDEHARCVHHEVV